MPVHPSFERVLADFSLPSQPGNERLAMQRVAEAVQDLGLTPHQLACLRTAVAEATMNAIEHGNHNRADLPVTIGVLVAGGDLLVRIADRGGRRIAPRAAAPDLEAKLAGRQPPRGWGLFLIRHMVDDLRVSRGATHHTLELVFHLKTDG